MRHPIDIPLLDAAGCAAVVRAVDAANAHWIARSGPGASGAGGFWTLGRASYIDVCSGGDPSRYFDDLRHSNALLRSLFAGLYERVRSELARLLGDPVEYTDDLALPGFHVFVGGAIRRSSMAEAHFDVQYRMLPVARVMQPGRSLSFTIPVETPAAGAGLDCWNVFRRDVEERRRAGIVEAIPDYQKREVHYVHAYADGTLVLHLDEMLHRIAAVSPVSDTDRRITMQGHGVRVDERWLLYW